MQAYTFKELRERLDLNKNDVHKLTGLSTVTISKYDEEEYGNITSLIKIALTLGCKLSITPLGESKHSTPEYKVLFILPSENSANEVELTELYARVDKIITFTSTYKQIKDDIKKLIAEIVK